MRMCRRSRGAGSPLSPTRPLQAIPSGLSPRSAWVWHVAQFAACCLAVVGIGGLTPTMALPATPSFTAVKNSTSSPKTAFQCEKRFKQTQSRQSCFNQLPGSSCAHPLEAEKAGPKTRGAGRYFKLTYQEEAAGFETIRQTYGYAPKQNVGICPNGAVYKVSLEGSHEHCEQTPQGEEYCSTEYDTKNLPEPTTRGGGEFTYVMTNQPPKSWHLVVKGYFIHPPWQHRR
jgi:hypothetical protein